MRLDSGAASIERKSSTLLGPTNISRLGSVGNFEIAASSIPIMMDNYMASGR